MSDVKCVVSDFDGTLTDPAREGPLFEELYKQRLAAATAPLVLDRWAEAARSVDSAPEVHGLVIGSVIAAPGDADPYVRCFTLTQFLNRHLELAPSYEALQKIAVLCYHSVYTEITERHWSRAMFRPGVMEFLSALHERRVQVWLVSNADVKLIERRLAALDGLPPLRLIGNAQKHWVGVAPTADPAFDALPEETLLAGLARPLKLRRGLYFEALRNIWRESGTAARDMLVVGDIYEMDLALPAALGASVHLIQNYDTREPYVAALRALGTRGGFSRDLSSALERVLLFPNQ